MHRAARHACPIAGRRDMVDEVRVAELPCRNVDRHPQVRSEPSIGAPDRELAHGVLEHPGTDRTGSGRSSSAMGMNSSEGSIRAPCGPSAGVPRIQRRRRVASSMMGWNSRCRSPFSRALGSATAMLWRRWARDCMVVENLDLIPALVFAWYMASSASRSSDSGESVAVLNVTPTLTVNRRIAIAEPAGSSSNAHDVLPSRCASSSVRTPARTTAKPSPPC